MKLSKVCLAMLVGICAFAGVSCATIIDSGPDVVTVNSSPSGATVYVDDAQVGQTPATIELDRARTGTIRIEKRGYEPITVRKNKELNGWLIGNICFGGIPGLIIDIATDNHKKFDDRPVTVNLIPVDEGGEQGRPISLQMRKVE